jgi:hypothetical protein
VTDINKLVRPLEVRRPREHRFDEVLFYLLLFILLVPAIIGAVFDLARNSFKRGYKP